MDKILSAHGSDLAIAEKSGAGMRRENFGQYRRIVIRLSEKQFDEIYGRLGVKFDHTLGESFYNSQLGNIVTDLLARGIARESEGAVAVFSDSSLPSKEDPFLVNREGEWIPEPALIR